MVAAFSKEVDISGFRRGYKEHAIEVAEKIKSTAAISTEKILETAFFVVEMKKQLNRKEFAAFVGEMLNWTRTESKKYLDIGRVFGDFDISEITTIEPFLLLKLCAKRFAPVVEALRSESNINSVRVQKLIEKLVPKPIRRVAKNKVDYGDTLLQKHAIASDGSFSYTLRETNLSEENGTWLEEKLCDRTVNQVFSEARQREIVNEYKEARLAEFEQGIPEVRDRLIKIEKELQRKNAENQELKKEIAALRSAQAKSLSNVESPIIPVLKEQAPVSTPPQELEETLLPTQEPEAIVTEFEDWLEFAAAMKCDRDQFLKLAKACSESERKHISNLLSNFLESEAHALDQACWVPESLLKSALCRLCFSVQRIVGGDTPSEEPRVEIIPGCKFTNLQNFGNRHECWIFELPNGKRIPIFGRDEFLIEVF